MPLADTLVSPLMSRLRPGIDSTASQESLGHPLRRELASPGAGPPRRARGPAPGSGASRRARAASASGSRGGTSTPVSPSRTTSGTPPLGTPPPPARPPWPRETRCRTPPAPTASRRRRRRRTPPRGALARRRRGGSPTRRGPAQRAGAPAVGYSGPCPTMRICTSGILVAEHGGGVQEVLEALARVHARDGEHDGAPRAGVGVARARTRRPRPRGRWARAPRRGDRRARRTPPGHVRAIAARHHDEVGARGY